MKYIETSARDSSNVNGCFEHLAREVLKGIEDGSIKPDDEVIV